MRRPMPTVSDKAFPIKNITVDTFDKDLNGINEHHLGFVQAVPLILDDKNKTYADMLREFAYYLIKENLVTLSEDTVYFHVKTNVFKKISISCLVKLNKENTDDSINERTTTSEK